MTEQNLPIRTVRTACPHDCPDTCSMLAHVKGNRLIGVSGNLDNPYTRGNLCRKVAHYEERVYAAERVLYPLRRIGPKGSGEWKQISWEEALTEIGYRWKTIIADYGPEAILPYSYAGTMGVVNMSACDGRLWYRMGASQLLRTICSAAAETGYSYVNGWSGGMDPEDFVNSRYIIAWGTNLSSTNVHLMPIIREAQAKGARFVVIDPFRTRTANAADLHIAPKPGTDAALALGIANVIFAQNLHDEAYLEAYSVGWKQYRDRCSEYPPETVEAITGIPRQVVIDLATEYATCGPSAIRLGYGLSRTVNGGGMIRAIACLPAVIGAWGKPGSGLLLSTSVHFPLNKQAIKRPDLQVPPDSQSEVHWGRQTPRTINMNQIGSALLELSDPPIKSLFVYNSNPAAVAPDSGRVRAGLMRDDLFLVVHEQMMTDNARLADILLPATSQLECLDLLTAYGHLYINLCQPAIAPLGEAKANIEVMNALANEMGFTESAFKEDAEAIIRAALDSGNPRLNGITYEYLQEMGFARLKTEYTPALFFENGEGFRTASGKIELYSEQAKLDGYEPLPDYYPISPDADMNLSEPADYPINLLSPAAHHFLNSTFAHIPSLQKGEQEPRIWIHAEDASLRGVTDGDLLQVWNQRGKIVLKAVISDRVQRGVAWTPSLWWQNDSTDGKNVNHLTSDRLTDMGGGSTFHTNLVQFSKLEGT